MTVPQSTVKLMLLQSNILHFSLSRFITTESLAEDERTFCFDCQLLILPDEQPNHIKHRTKKGITRTDLARPSYLMEAIENNKTNAVSLFYERYRAVECRPTIQKVVYPKQCFTKVNKLIPIFVSLSVKSTFFTIVL